MKEQKDFTEQLIKEELEREAQDIQSLLADFDAEELSAEQKSTMKEALYQRINAYEVDKVLEQLPEKYKEAMKTGLEVMEKKEEDKAGKKRVRKRKRLRVYAVLAAALIMVMALGINSFGGAERIVEIVKRAVGGREIVKVNSSGENLILEDESEEEAYQAVRDELGIEPVRIIGRPESLVFEMVEIQPDAQMAEFLYEHDGKSVSYILNAAQTDTSWGVDVEDEMTDRYRITVNDVPVEIKEYQTPETKVKRYSANFTHKNVDYFLVGTMEKDEFENMIRTLHFFS